MARQFNGTSDVLISAAAINLSSFTKGAYAFWLWVDAYGNIANHYALNQDPASGPKIRFVPDTNAFDWYSEFLDGAASSGRVTRPSAAAWHHFVINVDLTKASSEIDTVYIDGSSVSVTRDSDGNNTGNLPNGKMALMASTGGIEPPVPAEFLAGRLAEVAFWGGILLSGGDVSALYNGGAGALATSVQGGSLVNYWRILGTASPEPATVGGIDLTVTGTTSVAHPFGTLTALAEDGISFQRISSMRRITV